MDWNDDYYSYKEYCDENGVYDRFGDFDEDYDEGYNEGISSDNNSINHNSSYRRMLITVSTLIVKSAKAMCNKVLFKPKASIDDYIRTLQQIQMQLDPIIANPVKPKTTETVSIEANALVRIKELYTGQLATNDKPHYIGLFCEIRTLLKTAV
jgi:hypothetical protein